MTAKSSFPRRARAWLLAAASVAALGSAALQPAFAQTTGIKPAEIATAPLYAAMAGDRPAMLLAPSVEFPTVGLLHQYGGTENDKYDPAEEFLGYFNHQMCYEYNKNGGYFEITRKGDIRANEKGARCDDVDDKNKEFSGNFLNWVSASAIDAMRLALTGGDRVIDDESRTVLQRAYLPSGTTGVTSVTLMDGKTKNANRGGQCYWKHSSYFYTKVLKKSDGGGNYAGAIPKDMIEALDDQDASRPVNEDKPAQDARGKLFIANIGNQIHFGVHRMDGIDQACAYGPNNYVLGAGGAEGDFRSVRRNAFFGTSEHDQCAHGAQCDAGDKPRRVWYGSNDNKCGANKNNGCRWITGIVKGTFTCGTFGAVDNTHGDGGEIKHDSQYYYGTRKCYLEDDDANLSGDTPFFYARVKVCDEKDVRDYEDSKGQTFDYCRAYPGGKKPSGVIQKYADSLRMAAFGYLMDHTAAHGTDDYKGRFGAVLRAPMKYVGGNTYSPTGRKLTGNNPRAEWDLRTGVLIENPEGREEGVSGVINYFNRFGRNPNALGNYKQYDNVGEMYYEALRYMQGLTPTPEAVGYLDDYKRDGFPAYTSWEGVDPFDSELGYGSTADYSCVRSSLLIIGDINTHDPVNTDKNMLRYTMKGTDTSKNEFDIKEWRDVVLALEGNTGKSFTDGDGNARKAWNPMTTHDWGDTGSSETWRNINSFIPGMAYWAHTHDIRGAQWEEEAKQRPGLRVTSYFFDVNEGGYSTGYDHRVGTAPYAYGLRGNQFWLAAKYGGFNNQPGDGPYNTHNPFYDDSETGKGQPSNLPWSDLAKKQGDNKNGATNPEPRTYYMPDQVRQIIKAFDSIFGVTKPPTQRSIGGADSSGGLGGTSFQATFNGTNWSGDLLAEQVARDDDPNKSTEPKWRASERMEELAANGQRTIIMGHREDSGGTKAYEFTASALPKDVTDALGVDDVDAEDRIDWLRGKRDKETTNGGPLRARPVPNYDEPLASGSLIGDIINSGVKYVGPPAGSVNLGAGFDAYVNAQAERAGVVYVGANDGMLHAFAAETGDELFAYIPSWMRDKLAALTSPDYIHQAYVDATPVIGDAVIKTNPSGNANDWATVLVGGTGGGGKGVYALDVTDPTKFTKDSVLWEFTDADDPDMGYVLGQVRIVKLLYTNANANVAGSSASYRWFAMVPAGVNNYVPRDAETATADDVGNGNANIFLLALDKPASAKWAEKSNYWKLELPRIEALDATHPSGILNLEAFTGLGGVTEYVYAGDLHGQLWAFSFKGMPSGSWTELALSNLYNNSSTIKPLYVAKDKDGKPQPITVAPTILEGAGNGVHFVSFGTGKYFEPDDSYTKHANTFYTVYSNFNSTAEALSNHRSGDAIIAGRDALEEVKESASTDCNPEGATDPATCFKPSNEFFWGWDPADAPQRIRSGWYHDFGGSGEREVADATWITQTSRLTFSTLTPDAASETGVCGTEGGNSRVYTFDMISGRGFRRLSQVGMLAQPLVFIDYTKTEETAADSTGRRLRISPVMSGQFGAKGSSVQEVDTVIVPYGRLSWRRIDNFQELKNEEVK